MNTQIRLARDNIALSGWSEFAFEQHRIQTRLLALEAHIVTIHELGEVVASAAHLACIYSGIVRSVAIDSIDIVTSRVPNDYLFHQLSNTDQRLRDAGIQTLCQIGDCHAPASIAAAVFECYRLRAN